MQRRDQGEASRFVDEHLVTELIALERRIAADEYTITLARAADGADANKASLVEDLRRRIAETTSRLEALRVQLAGSVQPAEETEQPTRDPPTGPARTGS